MDLSLSSRDIRAEKAAPGHPWSSTRSSPANHLDLQLHCGQYALH